MEGSRGLEALGRRHEERAVQRRRAHHHAHSKLRGRSATFSVPGSAYMWFRQAVEATLETRVRNTGSKHGFQGFRVLGLFVHNHLVGVI